MNEDAVLKAAMTAGLTFELPPTKLFKFADQIAAMERKRICDMLLDMHAKEERHNYYGFIARMIKESA